LNNIFIKNNTNILILFAKMNSNIDSEISDVEPVDNYEEYEIQELENYEKEDEDEDEYEDEEEETDNEDEEEDEEDEEDEEETEDENGEEELEDYETDIDSNEPYSEYSDEEEDSDIEQLQDNLFDIGINDDSETESETEDKIIKEICYYQNTTHNLIPRKAFKLLCDEVLQDFVADYCFTKNAIDAIQVASEAYMIEILQKSNEIATHGKRKTIQPKDVIFSKRNRTEY